MIDTTFEYLQNQGILPRHLSRFFGSIRITDGCWLWIGARTGNGYGALTRGAMGPIPAHRISWMIHFGPIPHGLHVLHDCPTGDNKKCVNPAHLWAGTRHDNMQDALQKGVLAIGSRHPRHRLNDEIIITIRERWNAGNVTQRRLALDYGVTFQHISDIINRYRWAHIQ